MKYTILGATSFTGGHFVNYLKSCGDDVTVVPRHDINSEEGRNAIVGIVERSQPQYLVNFISKSLVDESWDSPQDWFLTNVVSTTDLLHRMKGLPFRYVHVSTPEVYGSGRHDEDSPFQPATPYALSRACMESMLNLMPMEFVITRSANVYGPGQKKKIIPIALQCLEEGKTFHLEGDGSSRRSFIHVTDVCRATKLIAEKGKPRNAYNIASNRLWSMKEIVEMIGCEYAYVPDRKNKDQVYDLVTEKVRSLGWNPTISLEEGMKTCKQFQLA